MRQAFASALALLAAVPLAGCDDIAEVCYACLKGDPAKPVPLADYGRIRIIASDQLLPEGATGVYYDETCGIDCYQLMRFDLPASEAEEAAAAVIGGASQPLDNEAQSALLIEGEDDWHWWIKQSYDGARGVLAQNKNARGLSLIYRVEGDMARFWVMSFST